MEIKIARHVLNALKKGTPVVALESTIISHGLSYPHNIEVAFECEKLIKNKGIVAATIGIIDGVPTIGLDEKEIEILAKSEHSGNIMKAAAKDISLCYAQKISAGTTVSATLFLADFAGIATFATGGIGGVHRDVNKTFDISSDLMALSKYSAIVVSAGCKSILDIPKTLEMLETLEVPIVGYKTDEFPVFYSRKSGHKLGFTTDNVSYIVDAFLFMQETSAKASLLVANPIPEEEELPYEEINFILEKALEQMTQKHISGKAVTPFLLEQLSILSEGKTVKANKALIYNNVQLATDIAINLEPNVKKIRKNFV